MAVSNLPFYSTSYGEAFGYNEREGSNLNHFRNRYLNEGYRGSIGLGPTRFNSTQSMAQTQQQTQPFASTIRATTAPANAMRNAFSSTATPRMQQQQTFNQSYVTPSAPASTLTNPISSTFQPQPYQQAVSASSLPSLQSQVFPASAVTYSPNSSSASYPNDFTQSPYYLAPPQTVPRTHPPSQPQAYSLYNGHYVFQPKEMEKIDPYGQIVTDIAKQQQKPAQSIPFGRIEAEDYQLAKSKEAILHSNRPSTSSSSSSFSKTTGSSTTANYEVPFDPSHQYPNHNDGVNDIYEQFHPYERSYDKWSISKRLPLGEKLRYHVPGYMGFVKNIQFNHSDTFGKATRKSIMEYKN